MLSSFNQCFVIDSSLTSNFYKVKEVNIRDNRKCLQNIKNIFKLESDKMLLRKFCQQERKKKRKFQVVNFVSVSVYSLSLMAKV